MPRFYLRSLLIVIALICVVVSFVHPVLRHRQSAEKLTPRAPVLSLEEETSHPLLGKYWEKASVTCAGSSRLEDLLLLCHLWYLEELKLTGYNYLASVEEAQAISRFRGLRGLKLCIAGIEDDHWEHLTCNQSIEELSVTFTSIDVDDVKWISKFSNLRELELVGRLDEGVIKEICKIKTLERVSINTSHIERKHLEPFVSLDRPLKVEIYSSFLKPTERGATEEILPAENAEIRIKYACAMWW